MKKKNKINGWRDVWTPPFAEWGGMYVLSSNAEIAWQWLFRNGKIQKDMVNVINGVSDAPEEKNELTINGCAILLNGRPIICVRGWGYLTGTGGLNLPADEATRIQDDFIAWIYSKLKGEI